MRNLLTKKVALTIGAGALTVGMLGSAALAAQPAISLDTSALAPIGTDLAVADGDHDRLATLRKILEGLVDKGVITAAQREAIVDAVQKAHANDHDFKKDILGDVLNVSAQYLGVSVDVLRDQLRSGKSLAEIAKATPGKTVDGLVDALTRAANAHIDKLVDSGKITKEQAEKLRAKLQVDIVKIVNHEHGPKAQSTKKK